MILCIKKDVFPIQFEIIKDIKLGDILINDTKYFDTKEEAEKENYVPIDFMVTVRSAYSNLVLEIDVDEEKRYYTNLTNIDLLPHKGYDLVMYLASIGLMHSVNYSPTFDDIMMKSQFDVIGVLNSDPEVFNPTVYSQIILEDSTTDEFSMYLKEGRRLVPISEMKERGNLVAILDNIIEVKEKTDECNDNNERI